MALVTAKASEKGEDELLQTFKFTKGAIAAIENAMIDVYQRNGKKFVTESLVELSNSQRELEGQMKHLAVRILKTDEMAEHMLIEYGSDNETTSAMQLAKVAEKIEKKNRKDRPNFPTEYNPARGFPRGRGMNFRYRGRGRGRGQYIGRGIQIKTEGQSNTNSDQMANRHEKLKCFNCQELGHIIRNCPKGPKNK